MRRRWLGRAARWGLTTLTAAVIAAWVLSLQWDFGLNLPRERCVAVDNGALWLQAQGTDDSTPDRGQPVFWRRQVDARSLKEMRWMFAHSKSDSVELFAVPLWWIALLLSAAALLAWRLPVHAALRLRRGACLKCGYARAGLAADALCPECGATSAR